MMEKLYHDMKLPGSLIYMDEALDEAAQRVLYQLNDFKNVNVMRLKHLVLKTERVIRKMYVGWKELCSQKWSVLLPLHICRW